MLKKKFYAKRLYICEVAFAQYLKINDIFAGRFTLLSSTIYFTSLNIKSMTCDDLNF